MREDQFLSNCELETISDFVQAFGEELCEEKEDGIRKRMQFSFLSVTSPLTLYSLIIHRNKFESREISLEEDRISSRMELLKNLEFIEII